MNFIQVLFICAAEQLLVAEFDRLHGTNLSLKGSPIDLMVDEATGRQNDDIAKFINFVYEFIWLPIYKDVVKPKD